MTALLFCFSATALGVDYGWQPVAGGGIEYIIQIEPALVDSLKEGRDLFSDLPSSVSNVRRYRIRVGNGRLPHHGEPPPASTVIQAGGQARASSSHTATDDRTASTEIDMSELPGPVLGPALVLEPSTDERQTELEEPKRFAAASKAEPIETTEIQETNHRQMPAPSTVERDDEENVETAAAKIAAKAHETEPPSPATEAESPSDDSPLKSDTTLASKSAMTLIGLFFSVVGNVFLLYIAVDQRSKYRSLVRRIFDTGSPSLTASYDANVPRWERLPAPTQQANSTNLGNEPHQESSG